MSLNEGTLVTSVTGASGPDQNLLSLLNNRMPFIAANGAIGRNNPSFSDAAAQRDALWTLREGLAVGSAPELGQSVLALSYAFKYQNANGSFVYNMSDPTQVPDDVAFFLEGYAEIYYGLKANPSGNQYSASFSAMQSQLSNAMNWLSSQSAALMASDSQSANRLLYDAAAFILNGQILNSSSLIQTGNTFLNKALALQQSSGAFNEYGGYDSSYQGTSMLMLETLIDYSNNPAQVAQLTTALSNAASWEEGRIETNGFIDVAGNTRTGSGQEVNPNGSVKLVNYPEVALSLYYASTILGSGAARAAADAVSGYVEAYYYGVTGQNEPSETRDTIMAPSSGVARGTSGADIIAATANNQTLSGAGGDDVFYLGNYTGVQVVIPAGSLGITEVATGLKTYTLSAGVDNLALMGNYAHTVTGNGLNNVIYASNGNDTISGGGGNVTIHAGTGTDTLTGGGTYDVFIFSSAADQSDTITDFKPGHDVVDMRQIFASTAIGATDFTDYVKLAQQSANTTISIDPTGASTASFHNLVTLDDVPVAALQPGRDFLYQ